MASERYTRLLNLTVVLVVLTLVTAVVGSTTGDGKLVGRPPTITPDADYDVYKVELTQGENYFALPIVPFDFTWDGLFGDVAPAIVEASIFDPTSRRWSHWLPDAPDASDKVPGDGLVFRVIARQPADVWFEGRRFTGPMAELQPLSQRTTLTHDSWQFLGACWDRNEGVTGTVLTQRLLAQNFELGRDYFCKWLPASKNWERIQSATGLNATTCGDVFMVCYADKVATDPYTSGGAQSSGFRNWLGYVATMSNDDLQARARTASSGFGDSFGNADNPFKISGHTYDEVEGVPVNGRCVVELPAVFASLTDLPRKVVGQVSYTNEIPAKIQTIKLMNIDRVVVDPNGEGRLLQKVQDLLVTADGNVFARGTLTGVKAVAASGTTTYGTLDVQMVMNAAWPSVDPEAATTGTEADMPALELEVPLGTDKMACLRWWKNGAGAVRHLDGWRVYFYKGYEDRFKVEQSAALGRQDIRNGWRAELEYYLDQYSRSERPRFRVPSVTKASSWSNLQFVVTKDEADMYAYESGLLSFKLNDAWKCHVQGSRIDYELSTAAAVDAAGPQCSLHLMYEFQSLSEKQTVGAKGGLGIAFEAKGLGDENFRFEQIYAGLELTGAAKVGLQKGQGLLGPDGNRDVREALAGIMWPGSGATFSKRLGATVLNLVKGAVGAVDVEAGLKLTGCVTVSSENYLKGAITTVGSVGVTLKPKTGINLAKDSTPATTASTSFLATSWKAIQDKFALTTTVQIMCSYDAFKPQGENDLLKNAPFKIDNIGAKLEFVWSTQTTGPNVKAGVQVSARVDVPDGWQTSDGTGVIDGSLKIETEYWTADRARLNGIGEAAHLKISGDFTATSDFTIRIGPIEQAPKPKFGDQDMPPIESGFGVSLARLAFSWERDLVATSNWKLDVSGMLAGHVRIKGKDMSWFAFGKASVGQDSWGDFNKFMQELELLFTIDVNLPIVDQYAYFERVFFSLRGGTASAGVQFRFRFQKQAEYARLAVMLALGNKYFRVTASIEDLTFDVGAATSTSLRSAFISIGVEKGAFDLSLGGEFEFPDIPAFAFFNQTKLKFGLFSRLQATREKWEIDASVYLRDISDTPLIGNDKFSFSFREIAGSWGLERSNGQTKFKTLVLGGTAEASFAGLTQFLDPKAEPKPVKLTMGFKKFFGNTSPSFELAFDADVSGLARFNFSSFSGSPGKIEDAGGVVLESFSLKWSPPGTAAPGQAKPSLLQCLEAKGSASLYLPKAWRDTFGSIGGSGFGVALPEKTTATIRSVGGLNGPFEIGTEFSSVVGLKLGELGTLGIDSFYIRKASPWAIKAGAAFEYEHEGAKKKIRGEISRGGDGAFVFHPDFGSSPFELKMGEFTFSIKDFLISFAPKTADKPMTFAIAGTVEGKFKDQGIEGTIGLAIAGDGSLTITLSLKNGIDGLKGLAPDKTTLALTVKRDTAADGTKKWVVELSVSVEYVIPKEFPLIGGTKVIGSVQGDTEGDFLFSVTSDPMPQLPIPIPSFDEPFATVGFRSMVFGRQGGDWIIAASGGMTLKYPFTQILGKSVKNGETPGPGDDVQLPGVSFGFEGQNLFIQFPDSNIPGNSGQKGIGLTIPLGPLGDFWLGLEYLRLSTKPELAMSGGFKYSHPTIAMLKFGLTFQVGYDPVLQTFNFDVTADPGLVFPMPPQLVEISRIGIKTLPFGLRAWIADIGCGIQTPLYSNWSKIKGLAYFDPGLVPPVGLPPFDYCGGECVILGFGANVAVGFPMPQFPDPMFFVQFIIKIIGAFSGGGDNPKTWDDLETWLSENREGIEKVFKGPGVGDLYLLMPYVMKDILPGLETTDLRVWPLPPITMKALKLTILPKMYFATDVMEVLGLHWSKCVARMLQMLYNLILVCKGEAHKVIAAIPEEQRHGRFQFSVPGFAAVNVGYDVVPDHEEYATEAAAGIAEFQRFHRLATHLEREYPRLEQIASGERTPVTTNFSHTDLYDETFKGSLKDTFVNLKPTIQTACDMRDRLFSTGETFDARVAFSRHMDYLVQHGAAFRSSKVNGDPVLEAKVSKTRTSGVILYGQSAPVTLSWQGHDFIVQRPFPFNSTFTALRRKDGSSLEDASDDTEDDLRRVAVTNHVEYKDGKLVLVFSATLADPKTGTVLYRATVPDQPIYDMGGRIFDGTTVLIGWRVTHALDDEGLGRAEFTDFGTMKITAPLTEISSVYGGSKLGKLRDAASFVEQLPVFDNDASSFLLANYFYFLVSRGTLPVEKRWSQGNTITSRMRRERDGGVETGEQPYFDSVLALEEVSWAPDEGTAGADGKGVRLSVKSDIKGFFERENKLYALPFKVVMHSNQEGEQPAEQMVSELLVLDASDDVKPLFESRQTFLKKGIKTLFQLYEELGLNFDFQQLQVKRASVSVVDGALRTVVRPGLVQVLDDVLGVPILTADREDPLALSQLKSFGPYGDTMVFPAKAGTFMVHCRGLADQQQVSVNTSDELVDLFKQDLLLREVDLSKPKGLFEARDLQGNPLADHLEARGDGAWEGGLRVPGSKLPNEMLAFVREAGGIHAHAVTETGRPVHLRRRFNGEVEMMVEVDPGVLKEARLVYTTDGTIESKVKYPTGRIIPGGFFVDGLLDLGQSQSLRGRVDFNGNLKTDGDFHMEGGCDIYVLGKEVASGRFIIDRRDGLYIYGNFDTGIAHVFIEGRLSKDWFSLVGNLDVRIGNALGIRAALTVNPYLFKMQGDVFIACLRVYHGYVKIDGTTFIFDWSLSLGCLSAFVNFRFQSKRDGNGKVTGFEVGGRAGLSVKLCWPFGTKSISAGFTLTSSGRIRVTFWKIYLEVDIPRFKLSWGWD